MGTITNSGMQFNPKGVTQGNTLVDPNTGLPITVIEETDGSRRLAVDANLSASEITVNTRDLNYTTDNVAIKGATGNELVVNSDGSIDVNTTISAAGGDNIAINGFTTAGTLRSYFNSINSVASGISTTIQTYVVPIGHTSYLQKIEVSGDNIAQYDIILNSNEFARRRTYFGGNLQSEIEFSDFSKDGLSLNGGDIITINVLHNRPYTGNFESRIQLVEI